MRTRPAWHPAQPGVLLYVPAEHVSICDTQESLSQLSVSDEPSLAAQSQVSNISDTVLPSCEDGHDVYIKSEPTETEVLNSSRSDSPETLAGDANEELLFDAVSKPVSTPDSSASSDFLFQLMAAAGNETDEAITSHDASMLIEPSPSKDFVDTGYASERTDFQETTPSPSLRRQQRRQRPTAGKRSPHFRSYPQPLTGRPVARLLDFARSDRSSTKKTPSHGALERPPSHSYTSNERELLCILYRFYHSKDVRAIPRIFNAIAGLELRHHIIRNYFETHMCLYGPESFRVFSKVLSVPFDHPERYYADDLSRVEQTAKDLKLDLQRRVVDPKFVSGKARKSKSPQIRKTYQTLVDKAQQEERDEANDVLIAEEVAAAVQALNTTSRAMNSPYTDYDELFVDVEKSPRPTGNNVSVRVSDYASTKPYLTFRVWDAANRTKFVDGSFVAHTFVDWPRPFPVPLALDDPSDAGKIFVVLHLSKQGDTPVYISTASSLLQALSYATDMHQPRLALINLSAPSLQGDNKVHHAADVFPWLKAQGLARWARYKGNGDYFVWADISSDAVLHTMDLTDLVITLQKDADCCALLNLDAFEAGTKTTTIAAALREKNLVLNTTVARALGKTAKAFGMGKSNVTLRHLQDLVARLMDGWTITKADTVDLHTMSSLAATFATALGPHAGGYNLQDIMGAFIEGVDSGTRCIARWSRSRSGLRRQRFRTA